jgi:hypothetical protein
MMMKYLAFPKKMCKQFFLRLLPCGARGPLPPSKYGPEEDYWLHSVHLIILV